MPNAFVGLGSNKGDRAGALGEALRRLALSGDVSILGVSPLYRTSPIGMQGEFFVNAVAQVATELEPRDLLSLMQEVEGAMGRHRAAGRPSSRRIDLDLLVFDGLILSSPALRLPHPQMTRRSFVLEPLAHLAPGLMIPGRNERVATLARRAAGASPPQSVRLMGPWQWYHSRA